MMSNGRDFSAVRVLLTSWNLTELIQHFEDEDINIEELQFMKPHQIPILLTNFKLGLRIRFEHYFEKWRRDTNRPLQMANNSMNITQCHCYCTNSIPFKPTGRDKFQQKSVGTNTEMISTSFSENTYSRLSSPQPQLQLQPARSPTPPLLTLAKIMPKIGMPKLTPHPRLAEKQLHSSTATARLKQQPTLSHTLSTPTSTTETSQLNAPSITKSATPPAILEPLLEIDSPYYKHLVVTVLDILNDAGSRGTSIIDYYKQHKELTPTHRSLLIQLIVNYFDHNDIHLSLNLSHNIETQILKLFPNEKLEHYRTEKRGKIYVKFCNMKRYRRDRPWPEKSKRRHIDLGNITAPATILNHDNLDAVQLLDDDDEYTQGFEGWINQQDGQIQIKNEHVSDDEYDGV